MPRAAESNPCQTTDPTQKSVRCVRLRPIHLATENSPCDFHWLSMMECVKEETNRYVDQGVLDAGMG